MRIIRGDVGSNWGSMLQEEGSPISAGIIDFHNKLMYYLIIILTIVCYVLINRIITRRGIINNIRYTNHSTMIEIIWTLIPALILLIIAIPSFKLLYSFEAEELVKPIVTVKITGNQWFWNYEISDIEGLDINFDSYTKSDEDLNPGELRLLDVDNRLVLPILTPIRLLITAQDVIHSFAIPSLGIKTDAIPGRINHASLFILRPSVYYGQCSELCGAAHEKMSIVLNAVPSIDYIKWLSTFVS